MMVLNKVAKIILGMRIVMTVIPVCGLRVAERIVAKALKLVLN